MVLTNTHYMELEQNFKQQNDPQEHVLDYNVSLNSSRFTTQKTAHRIKSWFPSQKIRVTYKADDLQYAITKLRKKPHMQCLLFPIHSLGKKSLSVNKLNCTLNTTTRTAYQYELVQSLLQLYQKNQLSLVHYLRDGKKGSLFSEH